MKFITILLTVFALKSCGNTKAATNLQDDMKTMQTETLSGKYLINTIANNNELPENIHLNFDETTNRVSGFSGCNRFSGEYTVTNNNIEFGALVSTKMYCKNFMTVEQNLLKALENTTNFTIQNNALTLNNDKENLINASKNIVSKITKNDDYTIEYKAISRGTFKNVTINKNSLTFQKDRSSKIETRNFSEEEITTLLNKMETINLNELESLEAPTKTHQYDGAPGATLKITKDGVTYQTQTFDHGNPNPQIKGLVDTILSLVENK